MAAPPWSEFIKKISDRQQHISPRKKYQSEGSPSTQDIIRRMRSNNFNQTDVEQFYMAFIKDFVFCRSALKKFSQKISIAFAAASIK